MTGTFLSVGLAAMRSMTSLLTVSLSVFCADSLGLMRLQISAFSVNFS